MKKWLRGALAGALLLSAALACGPSVQALADEKEGAAAVKVKAAPRGVFVGAGFGGYLNSEVHQKAYLTYLVKEYSPESMGEWEKAFAERKQVSGSMPKEIAVRLKGSLSQDGQPEAGKVFKLKIDPALRGSGGEADLPLPKEKMLFFGINNGDGTLPPLPEGLPEGVKDVVAKRVNVTMPSLDAKKMEEIKARADLMAEFDKAVESGSADSIRSLLPRILEDYREATARMAKFQEELKKEQTKQD